MRIIALALFIAISGCSSYAYEWKPVLAEACAKARVLIADAGNLKTYEQLREVLFENNPMIKLLKAKIEIKKHSGGDVTDYIPGFTASYDILDNNPSVGIKNIVEPILKAVFEKPDLNIEALKCSLEVLKYKLAVKLKEYLDEIVFSKVRLTELEIDLADKQAWYLYTCLLHEHQLLDNWEQEIKTAKGKARDVNLEIMNTVNHISEIKAAILSLCGVITEEDCDD